MPEGATCKICGGTLKIDEKLSLYVCEFCGTEFPLPIEEIERIELKHKEEAEKLKAEAKEDRKEINKKRLKIILPVIAGCIIVLISAFIIHSRSFRITDAHMTIKTGSDNYSNTINTYVPNIDEFRVAFTVHNAPENTFISFVWKNESGTLQKSVKYDISNTKYNILSAYLSNNKVWEEGNYSVEMYINDNAQPIKIVNFTVRKNTSDIILADLQMTTSVDANVLPIDIITNYPSNVKIVTLFGRLLNAPSDTKITFIWKYGSTQIYKDVKSDWKYANTRFSRYLEKKSWLNGSYSIEIYINNETTPSKTVNFSVGY